VNDVGKLSRCILCGDFHFSPDAMPECSECLIAATRMRSYIEARGGSLIVARGKIVVRTAEQRRDPIEALAELADVRRANTEWRT
jgi:hypothetical protein